ncbi:polyketide synthase regulator [Paenibacillus sp. PCH8]|uniref:PucR family transcriptional regulator n=1 Tax=Paenibacillus sp. PCH8 TaxID=2066524 RepID=UPI000CF9C754|nr:helix-turn-helix domain-containing protein [Paenibacillus sp. PCH8]PQP83982.1 polyketide synthase regulator [Paenibacillus sp. PCH8]
MQSGGVHYMKLIPDLKQQIELIIGITLDAYEITIEEWNQSVANLVGFNEDRESLVNDDRSQGLPDQSKSPSSLSDVISLNTGERIFFKVHMNEKEENVVCWGCAERSITLETKRFIELLIRSNTRLTAEAEPVIYENDREQQLTELGLWLKQQIEHPGKQESVPNRYVLAAELNAEKILFLLQGDTPDAHRVRSKELNKLLESYFGEEIVFIPLGEQEWIFMGATEIVTGEAEEDTAEARKDSLNAFCLGLHELVSSEWAGVFHLSASLPCIPAQQLVSVTALLEESVHLGRSFHVTQHIHLPWDLHLERLVASIPEEQRTRFIQETGKDTLIFNDSETLATMETFFSLDCNVSETAKRLFIHRNTLVYRLDKIKQEIGYDVRNFESAVLVQFLLLMYKVTKKL